MPIEHDSTEEEREVSEVTASEEKKSKTLEEIGVRGHLEIEPGIEGPAIIKGELNGHEVELNAAGYWGTIDGLPLDLDSAERLWKKYGSYAVEKSKAARAGGPISEEDRKLAEQRIADILKELL